MILYTGIIAAMYVAIAFVFGHLHSTEKKTIKVSILFLNAAYFIEMFCLKMS